jgi:hypothetical protein
MIYKETPKPDNFLIGLTDEDIIRMQNGGTVEVNPKAVGLPNVPIIIFYVSDEHAALEAIKQHPDTVAAAIIDSDPTRKN